MDTIKDMLDTLRRAWARQSLEAPEFFQPYVTKALRLALTALPIFAVLLLALAVLALVHKDHRRLLAVGVTFAVVLGLNLWAYWPRPVVAAGQTVQSVDLRTRVPGKGEKTIALSPAQQRQLLALLQQTKCRPGTADELPYAGYGQTFRIFLQTGSGTVCLYAAPDEGCRYTDLEDALVYPVTGYRSFYTALKALGAEFAPALMEE